MVAAAPRLAQPPRSSTLVIGSPARAGFQYRGGDREAIV